jgi:hypothetical protein
VILFWMPAGNPDPNPKNERGFEYLMQYVFQYKAA